jgi:hypothetical protein
LRHQQFREKTAGAVKVVLQEAGINGPACLTDGINSLLE